MRRLGQLLVLVGISLGVLLLGPAWSWADPAPIPTSGGPYVPGSWTCDAATPLQTCEVQTWAQQLPAPTPTSSPSSSGSDVVVVHPQQFTALAVGEGFGLLLLSALLVAQMRRP